MKDFKNKVVVISGAGSGIGRALSIDFAKQGSKLALCDTNPLTLDETSQILLSVGVSVYTKCMDVSNLDEVEKFAEEVANKYGPADIVINNAGIGHGKLSIENFKVEDMHKIMNVNFWGMVYLSKTFIPQLKKNEPAALINISSIAGLISVGNQTIYSASKFAIRSFTEGLISELKNTQIQVSCVHPGGIKTNLVKSSIVGDIAYNSILEHVQSNTAEFAAKKIISGIKQNKKRIIVGFDAKIAYLFYSILPLSLFIYFQALFLKRIERKLNYK
jgi:short-subunit dehydrogenase